MAKALMGHVGTGLDVRVTLELKRLRDRVRDLENEVVRLRAENSQLAAELSAAVRVDDEMLRFTVEHGLTVEPGLTVEQAARDHEPALT